MSGNYTTDSDSLGAGSVTPGRDKFDAWFDSAMGSTELAAAMAETRQLRALVAEILGKFEPYGLGYSCPANRQKLAGWRKRAGLPGMSGPPQAATVTAGQAAYEAMHKSRIARDDDDSGFVAWDELDETWDDDIGEGLHREDMEAAAKAATAAHALSGTGALMGDIIALQAERDRVTERVAELVTEVNDLRKLLGEIKAVVLWDGTHQTKLRRRLELLGVFDPQPEAAVVTAGTEHLAEKIRGLAIGAEEAP